MSLSEQEEYKKKPTKQLKCIMHRRSKNRKNSLNNSVSGKFNELNVSKGKSSLNISADTQILRTNSSKTLGLSSMFSTQPTQSNTQSGNWVISDSDRQSEKVSKKQVEIYGQVFEDIIKQDEVYGGLLTTVKEHYDSYILELESDAPPSNSQSTYSQIILEFEKLKNDIGKKDSLIKSLQDKLEFARENSREMTNKLSNDLKNAKTRERKYAKLIAILKDKEYPVEEIYTTHIQTRQKPTKSLSFSVQSASPVQRLAPK